MIDKIITRFAVLVHLLYLKDNRAAIKLLNAVTSYVYSGHCDSNAEEDSVCGGICATCFDAD